MEFSFDNKLKLLRDYEMDKLKEIKRTKSVKLNQSMDDL